MADKRTWAKMDVGYYSNLKWFKMQRALRSAMPSAMPIAIRNALRVAYAAHHASILYCKLGRTDGIFPVQVIKAQIGVLEEEEEAGITALFESGMWINHEGGMAEVRDYLDHQDDSTQDAKLSAAGKKAAEARWAKHAERNANRNANGNANRNAEREEREEKNNVAERADVNDLLDHLDTAVAANGAKKPGRNKTNHDAMRLLIDKDKRSPKQIKAVIDWATTDSFWKSNILCARSLREKYDQLYIKAKDAYLAQQNQQEYRDPYANMPVAGAQ